MPPLPAHAWLCVGSHSQNELLEQRGTDHSSEEVQGLSGKGWAAASLPSRAPSNHVHVALGVGFVLQSLVGLNTLQPVGALAKFIEEKTVGKCLPPRHSARAAVPSGTSHPPERTGYPCSSMAKSLAHRHTGQTQARTSAQGRVGWTMPSTGGGRRGRKLFNVFLRVRCDLDFLIH